MNKTEQLASLLSIDLKQPWSITDDDKLMAKNLCIRMKKKVCKKNDVEYVPPKEKEWIHFVNVVTFIRLCLEKGIATILDDAKDYYKKIDVYIPKYDISVQFKNTEEYSSMVYVDTDPAPMILEIFNTKHANSIFTQDEIDIIEKEVNFLYDIQFVTGTDLSFDIVKIKVLVDTAILKQHHEIWKLITPNDNDKKRLLMAEIFDYKKIGEKNNE
ncbi:MAG: hypothetical protein JETCAE03_32760 [Ignavibacteriaceae bacterium]|jgi:hypothetical protein|nr:MAG: hypothetical protein JETCAE03_32760 [Ignavibacteriaceae bacterium]